MSENQAQSKPTISADHLQIEISKRLDEIQVTHDFSIADVLGALAVVRVRAETTLGVMQEHALAASRQAAQQAAQQQAAAASNGQAAAASNGQAAAASNGQVTQ